MYSTSWPDTHILRDTVNGASQGPTRKTEEFNSGNCLPRRGKSWDADVELRAPTVRSHNQPEGTGAGMRQNSRSPETEVSWRGGKPGGFSEPLWRHSCCWRRSQRQKEKRGLIPRLPLPSCPPAVLSLAGASQGLTAADTGTWEVQPKGTGPTGLREPSRRVKNGSRANRHCKDKGSSNDPHPY